MKVLDLFCGTKSVSNAFKEKGHEVFTVDWEKGFSPTLCADIGELTRDQIIELCGGMRKMDFMQGLPRYTVTYCQYGERRQKPTDIWTNHPQPNFKPPCKRGEGCHEAAPRGARTGTQSTGNKVEKAKIPKLLCEHIVDICGGARNGLQE